MFIIRISIGKFDNRWNGQYYRCNGQTSANTSIKLVKAIATFVLLLWLLLLHYHSHVSCTQLQWQQRPLADFSKTIYIFKHIAIGLLIREEQCWTCLLLLLLLLLRYTHTVINEITIQHGIHRDIKTYIHMASINKIAASKRRSGETGAIWCSISYIHIYIYIYITRLHEYKLFNGHQG